MFVKVYLGYEDGVKKLYVHSGPALYGNLVSEVVRGRDVLLLWPWDFPLSARQGSPVKALRALWRPQLSVFLQAEFGITGLEQIPAGRRCRWVAQRWHCEPKSPADMRRELEQEELCKPREIRPIQQQR